MKFINATEVNTIDVLGKQNVSYNVLSVAFLGNYDEVMLHQQHLKRPVDAAMMKLEPK